MVSNSEAVSTVLFEITDSLEENLHEETSDNDFQPNLSDQIISINKFDLLQSALFNLNDLGGSKSDQP